LKLADILNYDPTDTLVDSKDIAIRYFARRDLLKHHVDSIEGVWSHEQASEILSKQQKDGSWKYSGKQAKDRPQ
jgi:hypothetical protein